MRVRIDTMKGKKYIDFCAAKRVSIVDILESHGIIPAFQRGEHLWYYAPWRNESNASLEVWIPGNTWHDFGDGTHGDSIDLVQKLGIADSTYAAAEWLLKTDGSLPSTVFPREKSKTLDMSGSDIIVRTNSISHPALLKYLRFRRVDTNLALRYCIEIHYLTPNRKESFAVALKNVNGGYAIRNALWKGVVGRGGFSKIAGVDTKQCFLFEGWMDMLSWMTLFGAPQCDLYCLNSTSNANAVIPKITEYQKVFCALDNDKEGRKCQEEAIYPCLQKAGVTVRDLSSQYYPYKDVNEYLMAKR